MNREEAKGYLLIILSIGTIGFFFITVWLGHYRDIQPQFLENVIAIDSLMYLFHWEGVVLFFTSCFVYLALFYLGWVGYSLYKGKNMRPILQTLKRKRKIVTPKHQEIVQESDEDEEEGITDDYSGQFI